ncbi:hypothetical protein AXF42_Ash011073 [Apostasia shenzhenica]|uniref:Cytochrome b561 and DOMON domain-containing protein n=1 Tax=Apostasia shenzhenica TaxID=1088818 RepID=A0A2H9ZR18_9ASPA|nr:hypothetical protein AXF42_Ash011073 [Apostasia shenzhenica]
MAQASSSSSLLPLLSFVLIAAGSISLVGGQGDSCDSDPSSFLSAGYSNSTLACRPIWNSFVLRMVHEQWFHETVIDGSDFFPVDNADIDRSDFFLMDNADIDTRSSLASNSKSNSDLIFTLLQYSQDKDNILTIVLSTLYTSGWVGIGFSKDGMMVGSSAMVGWIGNTGRAHIKQFYLRGRTTSQVLADQGQLPVGGSPPVVVQHGPNIYLAFQLKFTSKIAQQELLFAFGTATPVRNRLREHADKLSVSFDFSEDFGIFSLDLIKNIKLGNSGTGITGDWDGSPSSLLQSIFRRIHVGDAEILGKLVELLQARVEVELALEPRDQVRISTPPQFQSGGTLSASSYPYQLKRTHGILNIFGWGVMLPIGGIVARYFKRHDPLWFYLHSAIQFVGFILGLAGVVAGIALYDRLHASVYSHRALGILILVLGILQILAFFLRPDKEHKLRKFWNWYHWGIGRLTLFLAAVNIFVGIHVGDAGNSWKVGYGINLGVLLLTTIIFEYMLWTRWSKKTSPAF